MEGRVLKSSSLMKRALFISNLHMNICVVVLFLNAINSLAIMVSQRFGVELPSFHDYKAFQLIFHWRDIIFWNALAGYFSGFLLNQGARRIRDSQPGGILCLHLWPLIVIAIWAGNCFLIQTNFSDEMAIEFTLLYFLIYGYPLYIADFIGGKMYKEEGRIIQNINRETVLRLQVDKTSKEVEVQAQENLLLIPI